MPEPIGPFYPATWRRRPPGMIWDDFQAWGPYLNRPEATDYEYAYNVLLPVDPVPDELDDPALARQWRQANARKIDAVGKRDNRYTIFEARRRAGWSALAQLLGYQKLWPMFYPELKLDDRLVLVTDTIPDEIHAIAGLLGITTIVTGPPAPP